MSVVSFVALAAISTSQYYTPSGTVQLQEVTDRVVIEIGNPTALDAVLAKHTELTEKPVYADMRILAGVNDAPRLKRELLAAGAARQILPAYRTASSSELLIVNGKILARFGAELPVADVQRRVKAAGGASVRSTRPALGLYEVSVATPEMTVDVAARLHETHAAVWAHPNFIYRRVKRLIPNDPLFSDQWHHDTIGSGGAWDLEWGKPTVIIAIIDSGTDMTHPDLAGKIVWPRDAFAGDDDPTPDTYDAHGTGTAGLAAAAGEDGVGVIGVCPGCSIMPIRIMAQSGFGPQNADSDAFYWASDHGAQILSNSWGPGGIITVPYSLATAINHVADIGRGGLGSVILFASGNDYRMNESYELASHPQVMGIGATNYFDDREDYSNWGAELDLTAPAGSVTDDITGSGGYNPGGDYYYQFSGTSAATPVAAGVAGLIYSVDPQLTRGQVQSVLIATADEVGSITYVNGHNDRYGYGRVNALRAVQMARGDQVCQPITEICDDGIDNDCDALIDDADPTCAPDTLQVGIACNQDFECGMGGFCLQYDMGFPGGHCSAQCSTTCPTGAVCTDTQSGGLCFSGCTTLGDCRAGYDCMDWGSGPICVPSCTVSGCGTGETCNTTSGECEHDGPNPSGAACTNDLECADNGWCMTYLPDGMCLTDCLTDADCPEATHCVDRHWSQSCYPSCQWNQDCRDGYACRGEDDGSGFCWRACLDDTDCRQGGTCNEWGLCNDQTPPRTDEKPPDTPASDPNATSYCECDLTTACTKDCSCDPECDDSCAAVNPSWVGTLIVIVGLVRRRRSAKLSA